ncbi:MAG: glycosyl hydrolase family 57 [Planctomycetota bacterium]|jgi:hypothetical protein
MNTEVIAAYVDGLPNISGSEDQVAEAMARRGPFYLPESRVSFETIDSAFSIALHMHQPLIPAGGDELRTAKVISNLEHMMRNPDTGDNHNAFVFHWCYKRMGEMISQLVDAGKDPRVMLDYSGSLLHGLCRMGQSDVIESLRSITCDPKYQSNIEWLGTPWGHPVAPSTPVQDYRLHVRAWQHFFAALFGFEALSRVRGFSPSEMALPNHPDVCYEFVKTLKECGYQWVLVQEHTVERTEDSEPLRHPHIPHRLVARNSSGDMVSITAIIKTQGSDSKLVGQMQPYYEAKTLRRWDLAGVSVPAVVTQISDGENGGVMMNEFPPKYLDVMAECSASSTPAVNITEYLEYLESIGIMEMDFPTIQPVLQGRIWERFAEGSGPEEMEKLIKELEKEDDRFHIEGGSWTNNISWVQGYNHVLEPMQNASVLFAERVLKAGIPTSEYRYRNALFYLMCTQTSCFRYWGKGLWTDYGRELCRRTIDILKHDF